MKREIKFRGKRLDNGEWVYGFLVVDPKGKYRIYWQPFPDATSNTYHFVDPETIGQFTGLHDKNGREIWEGDIVIENGSNPYQIIWQHYSAQWIMQSTENGRYYREVAYDHAKQKYEVIGNIHDNSDLLQ